jgi:hypothetical protein
LPWERVRLSAQLPRWRTETAATRRTTQTSSAKILAHVAMRDKREKRKRKMLIELVEP